MKNRRNGTAAPDHEFSVVWSQERARFDVCRDGVRSGAFARDRSTAIGIAIREARQEALLTGFKIVVSSMLDGKRVVEWDGR